MLGTDVRSGQDRRYAGDRRKMSVIVSIDRRAGDERRATTDRRNDS